MKRHRSLLLACAAAAAVTFASGSPAEAAPAPCTASFHVLHDDHIGAVAVPAGTYQLRGDGVTCAQASSLFAQFLADYDGVLPKPWRATGENTFTGKKGRSFTFVRVGDASDSGAGGGSHGALECPDTFRVLQDDRVGRLTVPRGQYRVTLLGTSVSCDDTAPLLARFLRDSDGRLGGGWIALPSGEFLRNSTTDGFRIKPIAA